MCDLGGPFINLVFYGKRGCSFWACGVACLPFQARILAVLQDWAIQKG